MNDPRRFKNPGHMPSKGRWADTPIRVQWANGRESKHSYVPRQLEWERRGWDFDIDLFWKA